MARILCITSPVPGVLYAEVELSRRLAQAGHRLTCFGSAAFQSTVAGNGLEFAELEPSRYDDFLAADRRVGMLDRLRRLGSRRQHAVHSLAVDGLARAVRRLKPDLVLVDGEMHEHVIAATAGGAPVVLLNSFVSIWRRPGLPPPHHLARPGVGWRGTKVGRWLLWRALRLSKWWRAWLLKVRHVGCDRLSLLRALARERDFDLRREADYGQWLIPFTYRRLPVLSLHAREFDFPHRPPARVRYVGPMLLQERGEPRIVAQLEEAFERRRRGASALVYAGFGSFFSSDLGFVRRLIDAAAERSDWEVVISLGGRIEPAALGALPANVHAFSWLPQVEVLRHADVAVVHGGINTVDECVLCGVPMLVYCGFETDMAGITSRVVHHGIGIAGDRDRDDPRAIRERIERLLNDSRLRSRVERLRGAYLAYAEDQVAEREVEALLDAARTGRSW